jgi:hypothetical protein
MKMIQHKVIGALLLFGMSGISFTVAFAETPAGVRNGDPWVAPGGKGKGNKGTPATLSGKIISKEDTLVYEGQEPGLAIRLDLGKGEAMQVSLGPQWFLLEHGFNVTNGQPLTVVGVKINLESHSPTLIAHQVTQGERTLLLRDLATGAPQWSDKKKPPAKSDSDDFEPLTILTRHCAGCHQKSGHAGAEFLSRAHLSERATLARILRVIESNKMPPDHAAFARTDDGKKLVEWLKKQTKEN